MKRPIDIEALLRWAYRDELPKREPTGFSAGFGSHPVVDGVWTRDPGYPAILGAPHPDSLVIESEVNQLVTVEIDGAAWRKELLPEAWRLIEDGDIKITKLSIDPRPHVVSVAVMGKPPTWQAEFEVWRITGRNGKPVVVGMTEHGNYADNANCPVQCWPSPANVISERAEYVVWHDALKRLVGRLPDLKDYAPYGPEAPARPWLRPAKPVRVLRDLTAPVAERKVKRRVAA